MSKIILTGIKPTGMPHLGNYIGAIRPAFRKSKTLLRYQLLIYRRLPLFNYITKTHCA